MGHADSNPGTDIPLRDLLMELGFGGRNEAVARQALEAAGLTRPGRTRIASRKREDVSRLLRERFILVCAKPACQREVPGRTTLIAERAGDCALCGGSDNKLAVDRLCTACAASGLRRVVVVGGSPNAREALSALVGGRLQLRLVDGVARRTRNEARADLQWADLVVIWGGTQLDHKVSTLYTDTGAPRIITAHRRGVAALAEEVLTALPRLR